MERSIRCGKSLISGDGHFPDHCLKGIPRDPGTRTDCRQPFKMFRRVLTESQNGGSKDLDKSAAMGSDVSAVPC